MMTKIFYLCILPFFMATVAYPQRASVRPPSQWLSRAVPFKLIASNVRYDGVRVEDGDVCIHRDSVVYGGRSYYWSDAIMDGLFVAGSDAEPPRIYQPYDLARRAGWYKRRRASEPSNNVWGLFASGGKVWMGTDGLGWAS